MDEVVVNARVQVPLTEFEFRTSRSGGPGGQNVNKRETRVELVWDIATSPSLSDAQRARLLDKLATRLDSRGRLRIVSSEERSQAVNRERAIERFAEVVRGALKVTRPRKDTRPSKASVERRLEAKRVRGTVKRQRSRPVHTDDS